MNWFASKWSLLALGAGLAVIAGVVLGLVVQLKPSPSTTPEFSIDEIVLGMPEALPAEGKQWNPSSRLIQKRTYTTNEPLALRVVSHASKEEQTELSVRLLNKAGAVQALSPASISVSGGTSGYCCWTITTAGEYRFQIFTGTQAPFIVPVTIIPARKNESPVKLRQ